MAEAPACPQCGSKRVWKDGLRYLNNGEAVQRYICRSCGYRFSDPNRPRKNLKTHHAINNGRCGSRALALLEPRGERAMKECAETGDGHAGATTKQNQEIKGKIIEFLWWMKKQNYSRTTIQTYGSVLTLMAKRNIDLMNPEAVKEYLAKLKCSQAHKHVIAAAYTLFLKHQGLSWDPPRYRLNRKLPFIPTEAELDALIAGASRKMAAFLQTLKETAMRLGEAVKLKWENVDLNRGLITLNDPEKNGRPRIFNISPKLVNMLAALPKTSEYVFGSPNKIVKASGFYQLRRKLAHKLGNPRLLKIGLHTFRHWKATMLYHETKDPVYVMEFLGHKNLDTTLLYIQLDKALFKENSDNFIVKTAKNPEEIKQLLEVGFEYVCSRDGLLFFRKRK